MSESLEHRGEAPDERTVFHVGSDGETTGAIEHLKQVKLEFNRLSPTDPRVEIDLRKITGREIQVLFLDFGVPPRVLTISGDFRTDGEVSEESYVESDDSSPNTLALSCPSYPGSRDTLDNTHGNSYESSVSLRRGETMLVSHRGESEDTRNGFIENDQEISLSRIYTDDQTDVGEGLIRVAYSGHNLTLHTRGQSNAFVIYGRSIGFADRHDDALADSEELEQLLGRLESDDPALVLRELFGSFAVMAAEREDAVSGMETMEAMLAHSKDLLRQKQSEVWQLNARIRRLEEDKPTGQTGAEDWFKKMSGSRSSSSGNLETACTTLGLDPSILKNDAAIINGLVVGARKTWSKALHPDVSGKDSPESEEMLKTINAAADVLTSAYKK